MVSESGRQDSDPPLQDVHILMPGPCECVGQKEVKLLMSSLKVEKLSLIIPGGSKVVTVPTKAFKGRRGVGQKSQSPRRWEDEAENERRRLGRNSA